MQPSFEALYRDHFGLVWSVVARAGVSPASREDAVQEVWLTVHRRLGSYDDGLPAASWIAGIARHVVWRQIRATIRARRKLVALDRVAPDGLDDPMLSRERMRGIEGVIETLEPLFREAFIAVDIFGATGPEAAKQLGLPLNTLYSRLRLARARVHAGLDALEQQPTAAPPRTLAERTWMVIAPSLGAATTAPTTIVAFAVGLAAIVAVTVTAVTRDDPPSSASPVAIATTHGDRASPTDQTRGDVAEPPAAPQPSAPPQVATPSQAAARTTAASTHDPVAQTPDDESTLLGRAMQARRTGDHAAAMAALAEHERRFPTGALTMERKVERVRTLCAAGKTAQARREASALVRTQPDRVAVASLGDGCAPEP